MTRSQDGQNVPPYSTYSLSDFFNFPTYGQNPQDFGSPISTPLDQGFFMNYESPPTEPDDE